jgi:hypothetical protein
MNLRRGLIFAAIHTVIFTGMYVWNEAPYWHMFRAGEWPPNAVLQNAALQEDGGEIAFNPCGPGTFWDRQTSQMETVMAPQIGFLGFAGFGHVPCSSESGIEKFIEARLGSRTKRSEACIGLVTCVAVAMQWLLVGGVPVVRPRRWWLEPGAFITACVCIGAGLLCADELLLLARRIPDSDVGLVLGVGIYRLVVLPALLMWLAWLGLSVWRFACAGWTLLRRPPRVADL